MTDTKNGSIGYTITASILIAIGLAVFAIRLHHEGPYAMPHGGALYGGIGLLVLGGCLLWQGKPRWAGWIAIAISPVALFPVIYSIVGESEEVISLYATDSQNRQADLRLWIVDREDGPWVGMPRAKAIEHSLDGAQLQMLRGGEYVCVMPVLHEDRPTVRTVHTMKVEKYTAAQVAGAIGMYPREAPETSVALRLDTCPQS